MRLEALGVGPVLASTLRLRALHCRLIWLTCLAPFIAGSSRAAENLVPNGGFESGFTGWTCWGQNADLITLDTGLAHSGTNSARIQHGHNALYFSHPLNPQQAYELRFAFRLTGANPSGQISLGFSKAGGTLRSAVAQPWRKDVSYSRSTGTSPA